MRLTKFNPETGQYEYIEKAKTQAEYNEQRKAVIQKLGAIEDENGWVSVEDRLPKQECGEDWFAPDSYILCATKDKKVFVASYSHQNKYFWYRDSLHPLKDITHWQPLPEPPKEDTE